MGYHNPNLVKKNLVCFAWHKNHTTILHVPWQLSIRDMSKLWFHLTIVVKIKAKLILRVHLSSYKPFAKYTDYVIDGDFRIWGFFFF